MRPCGFPYSRRNCSSSASQLTQIASAHADDLGLGELAPQRLGITTLGLHPGQRVERRHERHPEVVLEPMADDPAQPVVGVDDIGLLVLVDPVEHAGAERVGDVGERLLRQVVRTRLDVHDAMTGLDEDLARQPGTIGAGERRAVDPRLGEGRHRLADVDVHASTVAGTGLEQRRRVERDHRDTLHSRVNDNQAATVDSRSRASRNADAGRRDARRA